MSRDELKEMEKKKLLTLSKMELLLASLDEVKRKRNDTSSEDKKRTK